MRAYLLAALLCGFHCSHVLPRRLLMLLLPLPLPLPLLLLLLLLLGTTQQSPVVGKRTSLIRMALWIGRPNMSIPTSCRQPLSKPLVLPWPETMSPPNFGMCAPRLLFLLTSRRIVGTQCSDRFTKALCYESLFELFLLPSALQLAPVFVC